MADIKLTVDYSELKGLTHEQRKSRAEAALSQVQNQKLAKTFADMQPQIRRVNNEMRQYAIRMQGAGKAANRLGVATQQAGYQVGDFFVQIQSGTNPFVAFGQQATQLVGVMGMLNPALVGVSAALGIAIPVATAIGAALYRASDAAEEKKEKVKSLNEALNDLDGISKRAALSVKSNLEEAFKGSAVAVKGLLDAIDQLEFSSTIKPIKKAMDDISVSVDKVDIALKTLVGFQRLKDQGVELDNVQKALLESAQALVQENLGLALGFEGVKAALDKIGQSRTSKELSENFAKAKEELEKVGGPAAEKALEALVKIAKEAGIADSIMNSLADAAGRLGDNLAFAADISPEVQARAVRAGVESGAIPPEALKDLPQTEAEKAWQKVLEGRREAARKTKKTSGGSRKSPAEQLEEYMQKQEKQLEIQRTSVMLGEEQARVSELLNKYKEAGVEIDMKRIQQLAEEEQRLKMLTYAHSALENALMSVVDGTQSVGDAFKAMLRDMILEIYREKVAKSFASSVLSIFGFSKGGVFNNGNVTAFANGGVVNAPTYFPMGSGGMGLMGEAGPEAIMPLKRGANGKLGVEMTGGGQVVVNQNINISTGVQQTVRNEIKSMMPQIAEQSKAAVLDAKRRGGMYGGKF